MKHIWRILVFTKSLWRYYVVIGFFTITIAILSQLTPLLTKAAIDEITKITAGGEANVGFVAMLAGLIFLADAGQTVFSNIGGYFGDMMSIRIKRILSERYYEHMLSLPQTYFDNELSGKIINRLNRGINQLGRFMQFMSNNFLQFIFSTVFSLAIVAYYSWEVALMLSLLYPIFIWMTTRTSNKWQKYQSKINLEIDTASGRFNEAISQIKVVKSFMQTKRELKFFSKHYKVAEDTTSPQSVYWHTQDVKRGAVLNIIFLGVFAYIFVQAANGRFTIGEAVLLIQYAALIRIPIFTISFLIDETQRAISDSKDYFAAMDEPSESADAPNAPKLKVGAGRVTYQDVDFTFGDTKVFKGLSFDVAANSKVALVGESGAGKTTITNLLLRLYEVDNGTITIDEQNVAGVSQGSLRQQIGVVFQEPALFSGTVRENIAYANPRATEAQVTKAAKAANAHEFIAKLKDGYNTEIGERGLKLSGGQKQRIAIARALLKDAPILILDEATSSLDTKSELLVQEALETLMKDRTTIIIAHRLSTIQSVDKIISLSNGKVAECGSPKELADSGGIYSKLLSVQTARSAEERQEALAKFGIVS